MVYNSGQIEMKKYLIVLSTLVLFAFSSCQKFAGDPITKDFTIGGTYTELEVQDAFEVTVSDVATQVTVTAGENVMPKVIVEIVGNTLKIRVKPMATLYGGELKAVIPYNADLTSVDLSGASEFHSEFGLEGQNVEVELSGASDFYCDIDADDIKIDLSGSSNFHGNAVADKVEVHLSGSSDFFGDVLADEIDMELSGSSSIEGNVSAGELDLEMSGASDATLVGHVTRLKIDLEDSSNIVKKVVGNHYALICDNCEGKMSGSSDVYIHCDGSIKVNLSGSSELHFTGNAFTGDSTTSGSSNIIHEVNP
jgi:hypothetical protein